MAFEKGLNFAFLFVLFCASTFSAAVPKETFELVSPSQDSSLALVNGSTITNITDVIPSNALPPDPYILWPWDGSRGTSVTFSNYDSKLWYTDALNVILAASRAATIQIYVGKGDKAIARTLNYDFGSVSLNLQPLPNLNWNTWLLALSSFTEVFRYEYTGFSFTVNFIYIPAGTGFLRQVPTATPQVTPQSA